MNTTTEVLLNKKNDAGEFYETRTVRYLPILELDNITIALSYLPKKRKPDAYIAIHTPTNRAACLRAAQLWSVEEFLDDMLKHFGSHEGARQAIMAQMYKMGVIKAIQN
jgi:hypothetical protein